MIKSKKTRSEILKGTIELFTSIPVPADIFEAYVNDRYVTNDGDGTMLMQEWIINNLRPSLSDWATGIGVIEAAEGMYECAKENGNLLYPEPTTDIEIKEAAARVKIKELIDSNVELTAYEWKKRYAEIAQAHGLSIDWVEGEFVNIHNG